MKKDLTIWILFLTCTAIILAGVLWCVEKGDREMERLGDIEVVIPEKGPKNNDILNGEDIDTSDWKTYRNEELGFEVKYPEDWEVWEPVDFQGRNRISFHLYIEDLQATIPAGWGSNEVVVKFGSDMPTVDEYLKSSFCSEDHGNSCRKEKDITINDVTVNRVGESVAIGDEFIVYFYTREGVNYIVYRYKNYKNGEAVLETYKIF